MSAKDSPSQHAADTIAAGAGLNEPSIVRILTSEGPEAMRRLIEIGARFDRDANGDLALGREAAHSQRRILHAMGDATGAEIVRALRAAVAAAPGIEVLTQVFAWDLVCFEERITGLTALHPDGSSQLHLAPAIVMATGGMGQLFERTTNPVEVTGDGMAMATRAGAKLLDMEFVQFHPTALNVGRDPMPLVTEAVRGEGAILINDQAERFMLDLHPDAELAPRDVVARGIWSQIAAGREVFLDARECLGQRFPERFPTVFKLCMEHGIDPRRSLIPVSPASHYSMGGLAVDEWGKTSLTGLWACGEVTASGAHGANRLASNSLLEGLVFGARVAESVGEAIDARGMELEPSEEKLAESFSRASDAQSSNGRSSDGMSSNGMSSATGASAIRTSDVSITNRQISIPRSESTSVQVCDAVDHDSKVSVVKREILRLRRCMWRNAGLVRSDQSLRQAMVEIQEIENRLFALIDQEACPTPLQGEARNLLSLARLVVYPRPCSAAKVVAATFVPIIRRRIQLGAVDSLSESRPCPHFHLNLRRIPELKTPPIHRSR